MSDATLILEPRLDFKAAAGLADSILTHQGKNLTLDAAHVSHVGAMGLQVLRAAARSWAESDQQITLVNLSDDCADQLSLLGFTPQSVTEWEDDT
jgi:chemotaxis protein CheX